MILFIYGNDSYRIRQTVDEIVRLFKEKRGPSADVFARDLSDSTGEPFEELVNNLKAVSFFSNKKAVLAKNPFSSGLAGRVLELIKERKLEEDKDLNLVLIEAGSSHELQKKHKELWRVLSQEPVQSKKLDMLSGKLLESWIESEAAANGTKIKAAAVRRLIELAGRDSWRLAQEISKLAAYAGPEDISEEHITALVAAPEDQNIFAFLDALAARNRVAAIRLLSERLSLDNDSGQYIISMVAFQLRNMVAVKDMMEKAVPYGKMAEISGLHPFVIKKAYQACRHVGFDELRSAFGRLARLDLDIKNGEVNPEDGLYQFVLEF